MTAKLPTLREVRASAKARGLPGLIVVGFDGEGFKVVSYGSTRAKCAVLGRLADHIADSIEANVVDLSALRARAA